TTSMSISRRSWRTRSMSATSWFTASIRRVAACSLPWAGSRDARATARLVEELAELRRGVNRARAVAVHLLAFDREQVAVAHRAQRREASPELLPRRVGGFRPRGADDRGIGGEHRLDAHY